MLLETTGTCICMISNKKFNNKLKPEFCLKQQTNSKSSTVNKNMAEVDQTDI